MSAQFRKFATTALAAPMFGPFSQASYTALKTVIRLTGPIQTGPVKELCVEDGEVVIRHRRDVWPPEVMGI